MVTLQLHSPVRCAAVMDVADVPAFAVRETNQTGPPKPRLLDRDLSHGDSTLISAVDLAISAKTAKALGLTIPQAVLLSTDHVVE